MMCVCTFNRFKKNELKTGAPYENRQGRVIEGHIVKSLNLIIKLLKGSPAVCYIFSKKRTEKKGVRAMANRRFSNGRP